MTLLDEVKKLHKMVKYFDVAGRGCESSGDMQYLLERMRKKLRGVVRRHSQPPTPGAVAEWMKGKGAKERSTESEVYDLLITPDIRISYYLRNNRNEFILVANRKPLTWIPLSAIHSLSDLETLVRLLGVENV